MAPVELYSDLYWELIGVHARMMVSHKQNVLRIFPSWHVLATYDNGKYTFDFSRFDREVELFDAVGETPLKRIEGGSNRQNQMRRNSEPDATFRGLK